MGLCHEMNNFLKVLTIKSVLSVYALKRYRFRVHTFYKDSAVNKQTSYPTKRFPQTEETYILYFEDITGSPKRIRKTGLQSTLAVFSSTKSELYKRKKTVPEKLGY